jgi:hypothetical protein
MLPLGIEHSAAADERENGVREFERHAAKERGVSGLESQQFNSHPSRHHSEKQLLLLLSRIID